MPDLSHTPGPALLQTEEVVDHDLRQLDRLAKLLDNQFRIPGTQVRFGLDAIIGLIPYVGDIVGFIISGFFLRLMIKRGAGPMLMLRMLSNYLIDAVVGIVPFFGDLFDVGFKANRRNVALLRRYYAENEAPPSIKWTLLLFALVFLALLLGVIWLVWTFTAMLISWVWQGLF